jgi:hypothetical protein
MAGSLTELTWAAFSARQQPRGDHQHHERDENQPHV